MTATSLRGVGSLFSVSLAILACGASAEEPRQELDCSRVYLGDLDGDLQRAEEEVEQVATAAADAASEVEGAEVRARELEIDANVKEGVAQEARRAADSAEAAADECEAADRDLAECARLRSAASAADTRAFTTEQDAMFATRDAERARRGAVAAAERASAADRSLNESRAEVERLRTAKHEKEACSEREAEPVVEERSQRWEATVSPGGGPAPTESRTLAADEWAALLAADDGAAAASALASCTAGHPPKVLERTVSAILLVGFKGYPEDDLRFVVGEALFQAAEDSRNVNAEAFDLRLLRSAQFQDKLTLDGIKRQLSRLDRNLDADYEIRREGAQWWQRLSLNALQNPFESGVAGIRVLRLLHEEGHPSSRGHVPDRYRDVR